MVTDQFAAGQLAATRRTETFFDRDPAVVAVQLLGGLLAHRVEGRWMGGVIVETEAYLSAGDAASHSFRGQRPGNRTMFAAPGRLYVYPIHAKYCMNIVTEAVGRGSAVLLRAIQPVWAVDSMIRRRQLEHPRRLTSGPGMLCQAMAVDRRCDGTDLCTDPNWWLSKGVKVSADRIARTPRIGITDRCGAEAVGRPLRFFVDGNRFVSGRAADHRRPRRDVLVDPRLGINETIR